MTSENYTQLKIQCLWTKLYWQASPIISLHNVYSWVKEVPEAGFGRWCILLSVLHRGWNGIQGRGLMTLKHSQLGYLTLDGSRVKRQDRIWERRKGKSVALWKKERWELGQILISSAAKIKPRTCKWTKARWGSEGAELMYHLKQQQCFSFNHCC